MRGTRSSHRFARFRQHFQAAFRPVSRILQNPEAMAKPSPPQTRTPTTLEIVTVRTEWCLSHDHYDSRKGNACYSEYLGGRLRRS